MNSNLKLVVLPNAKFLGEKVDENLKKINNSDSTYIVPITSDRFSNGEGKVKIEETVRDKDLYILSDIGNYSINYDFHGMKHFMAPDEHFQDIKRIISATSGHASKINVIMPMLYQSRQHKRKGRESLDCALALQELERIGVSNIITFDAHDPNVVNAVPNLSFDNFYPTNIIIDALEENEHIDDIIVVSPDIGAMERARYYAGMLGCDVGLFYKRRDLTKVVNGKNPIVEHVYLGSDVKDKNILIVDDMISSGTSMIESAQSLKNRGAKKIYLVATFALFTEGIEKFNEAYNEGIFTKLYVTNLSYVPEEIKSKEWYTEVDCSMLLARIINKLNKKESIAEIYDQGRNRLN
ncbi:MAG: ribose-phosphate diphosphokinase [Bacilli bacterium]